MNLNQVSLEDFEQDVIRNETVLTSVVKDEEWRWFLWGEPYARCKAKGDTAAIATLESSYLSAADESIAHYRSISHMLYQRIFLTCCSCM